MLAALTADLLILRPTAMYINQLARRWRKETGGLKAAGEDLRNPITCRAPARSRLPTLRCQAIGSTRSSNCRWCDRQRGWKGRFLRNLELHGLPGPSKLELKLGGRRLCNGKQYRR